MTQAATKAKSQSKAMSATTEKQKEKKTSGTKHPLSPHLVCDGAADAIAFYKKAFGAEEMIRLPGTDGKILHACISINGAPVMLVDADQGCGMLSPKSLNGTPVSIHLNVEDVDAFVDCAVRAGATVVLPIEDAFWGDRFGVIEDPFGHKWSVATHVHDMSADELKEAARKAMAG